MPNKVSPDFWTNYAVENFVKSVWRCGLLKFALDTEEEATLEFGNLSIEVIPGSLSITRTITLEDSGSCLYVTLEISLDEEPNVILINQSEPDVTDLIYDISDSWTEGFFNLREE